MITVSDEILTQTLQEVVDTFLIPKFLSLGMNASGSWINALRADVVNGVGYIKGKDYTYWLVNGRLQNKDQSEAGINHFTKWAGHFIFKKWVQDKGISANPYAVARSVAKKGTSYSPNGTDLLEVLESKEVKDYIYKKLAQDISLQLRSDIVRRLKNTLK